MGTPPGETYEPVVPTYRGILEDVGSGICFAGVTGSAYYFPKGVYDTLVKGPNTSPSRTACLVGGSQAVMMKVPRFAGSFAAFLALSGAFECSMARARGKVDMWNCVTATAASVGVLTMCSGGGLRRSAFSVLLAGSAEFTFQKLLNQLAKINEELEKIN